MTVAAPTLSPRRQKTRARRLAQIHAAALSIVSQDSLDALTMARLADAVELTPGALYRYFPSKDALLAELQALTIERIQELFEEAQRSWATNLPAAPGVAALAELLATADFYLQLAAREPPTFRLVAFTLGDPRPLVDDGEAVRVARPLALLIARVSKLFAGAVQARALSVEEPVLATIVFWTSLHGIAAAAKLDRLDGAGWFAPARLAHELTRSLLLGWGAPPLLLDEAQRWQRQRATRTPGKHTS